MTCFQLVMVCEEEENEDEDEDDDDDDDDDPVKFLPTTFTWRKVPFRRQTF